MLIAPALRQNPALGCARASGGRTVGPGAMGGAIGGAEERAGATTASVVSGEGGFAKL